MVDKNLLKIKNDGILSASQFSGDEFTPNADFDKIDALKPSISNDKAVVDSHIKDAADNATNEIAYVKVKESYAYADNQIALINYTDKDYAKTVTGQEYEALKEYVADFKTSSDALYAASKAVTVDYVKFRTEVDSKVKTLNININIANNNDIDYKIVVALISSAKTAQSNALKTLKDLIVPTYVYNELYSEAQSKLMVVLTDIYKVEENNGCAESHNNATENRESNETILNGLQTAKILSDYQTTFANLKKAYIDTISDDIIPYCNRLVEVLKLPNEVITNYLKTINELSTAIAAVKTTIDTQRKVCIGDNAGVYNNANATATIETKLSDLEKKTDVDKTNYNAYIQLVKDIKDLQGKFNAAKLSINGDGKDTSTFAVTYYFDAAKKIKAFDFTTAGKYTYRENELQKLIVGFTVSVKAAYKNNSAGTYVSDYDDKFADALKAYYQVASEASDDFKKCAESYIRAKNAYDALYTEVTNGSVTIGSATETYGAKLNAENDTLKNAKKLLDDVNSSIDGTDTQGNDTKAFTCALAAAVKYNNNSNVAAIITEAEALKSSYAEDKKKHETTAMIITARMNNIRAATMIDIYQARLDSISGNFAQYGLSWNTNPTITVGESKYTVKGYVATIQSDLAAQTELRKLYDEESEVMVNPLGAISVTNQIKAILEGDIYNKIVIADSAAFAAVKRVRANESKNADLSLDAIKTKLDKITISLYKDVDTGNVPKNIVDYTAKYNTSISQLKGEIGMSYSKETLVADASDINVNNVTTAGFNTRKSNLSTNVDRLFTMAENCGKNYDAYLTLGKYRDDKSIAAAIEIARNGKTATATTPAVEGVNTLATGDGKTYFTTLLNYYNTELKNINDLIESDRIAQKSLTNLNATKLLLNNLLINVNKVPGDASACETAHTTLVDSLENTKKYFAEVYSDISDKDVSTLKQEYLKQLDAQQSKLVDAEIQIDTDFKKGVCADAEDSIIDSLFDVKCAIMKIAAMQKAGYSEDIAEENSVRYDEFSKVINITKNTYTTAINNINSYLSITNPQYKVDVNNIAKTNRAIYQYPDLINALIAGAQKACEDAIANMTLYDNSNDIRDAKNYKVGIDLIYSDFVNKINVIAKTDLADKITEVEDAVADAKDNLTYGDSAYTQSVKDNAFADVCSLCATAKLHLNDLELALIADKQLAAFDSYSELITAGYNTAAKAQWNYIINDIDTVVGSYGKTVVGDSFLARFEKDVTAVIDSAKAKADKSTNLYNDLAAIYKPIKDIKETAKAVSDEAKCDSAKKQANDKAYTAMKSLTTQLQLKLDSVVNFVDAYQLSVNSSSVKTLNAHREAIKTLNQTIENDYADIECQNAVSYNETTKKWSGSYIDDINWISLTAENQINISTNQKVAVLKSDIVGLKYDYNQICAQALKAYYTDAGLKVISDSIERLSTEIMAIETALDINISINTKYNAYVDIAEEIGRYKSYLVNLYNATKIDATKTALATSVKNITDMIAKEITDLENSDFDKTKKDEFRGKLDAIYSEADETQTDINVAYIDNVLLTRESALNDQIKAIAAKAQNLVNEIDETQKPYTINKNTYNRAYAEITAVQTRLDSAVAVIKGYRYADPYADSTVNVTYKHIRRDLNDELPALRKKYDAIALGETYSYVHRCPADYNAAISEFNLTASLSEFHEISSAANVSLDSVNLYLDRHTYNTTDWTELNAVYTSIQEAIGAAETYLDSSHSTYEFLGDDSICNYFGMLTVDIAGKVQPSTKVYYSQAVAAFTAKMSELQNKIDSLAIDAEAKAYIQGDADGDGEITINDYTYIKNIILESGFVVIPEKGTIGYYRADATGDSEINVADAVSVVNTILGKSSVVKARKVQTQSIADSSIELVSEGTGINQHIAINLNNSIAFVGGQLDIVLPQGITLNDQILGNRANAMELASNTLSNGATRVLISSAENLEIEGSEGAIAYLNVTVSRSYNGAAVEVGKVIFADSSGNAFYLEGNGEAAGISTVTTTEYFKGKIYSAGGRLMNGVRKCINIIRNSDGTSKKIYKK